MICVYYTGGENQHKEKGYIHKRTLRTMSMISGKTTCYLLVIRDKILRGEKSRPILPILQAIGRGASEKNRHGGFGG